MAECLFCAIAAGNIPCREVYADDEILAFHDVNPQAPTHVLVIPRRHIGALTDLVAADADLVGRLLVRTARVAAELGLDPRGYRVAINCGRDGCQSVPHLHLHLLGGRPLGWPPG